MEINTLESGKIISVTVRVFINMSMEINTQGNSRIIIYTVRELSPGDQILNGQEINT